MSTVRRRAVSAEQWGIPDRNADGEPICRWCRSVVRPPRRTFCGAACVHEWKLRSDPGYVREQVWTRDGGVCRLCGFDVGKAERRWMRARPPALNRTARRRWRAARPRWEADHIVPVAEGGGECGLDNYRLLCRSCHLAVTLQWRRASRARESGARHQGVSHWSASEQPRARQTEGPSSPRTRFGGLAVALAEAEPTRQPASPKLEARRREAASE